MKAKDVQQGALLSLTSEKHLVEVAGTKPPTAWWTWRCHGAEGPGGGAPPAPRGEGD